MLDRVAGIPLSVMRNGLVVTLVQNRRRRSRLFLISGPLVSVDIWGWPAAPDTAVAIAVAPGPRPGSITSVGRITVVTAIASVRRIAVVTAVASVRMITVVTAIAPITITPLDILAFDVATLINKAWSARVTSRAVGWAVGRVAATVGTGIGSVIVTSLRRCCDHRRTEQCEDARDDQCQSAAASRASGNSTVHCKLQHARADPATVVTKKFRPKCDRLHARPSRQERVRFLRMRKPTWESCEDHAVTADLSESNHEDFRQIPGTPAQPTCVAAIGVNPLLNFPDMRRMRCSDFSWPSLNEVSAAPTLSNLLLRHFDQTAIKISIATRGIAP